MATTAAQSPDELAPRLDKYLESGNCVLFAGAGTSARVGLPTWASYMEHLAAVCDVHHDAVSASLIRQRAQDGDFLGAAAVYKSNSRIPVGERLRQLASPFSIPPRDEELKKLFPLLSLPFAAFVTTNYDRVLHEAYSRSVEERRLEGDLRAAWPIPVERDDGSLRGAALRHDFFIARIHGRAEKPESIILDSSDYGLLDQDSDYKDFLLELLRSKVCLFVGFSFLDPAIQEVLSLYKSRFGPVFPALHAALVPAGQTDLLRRLHEVNIEYLTYDSAESHVNLWRAIRILSERRRPEQDRRATAVSIALKQAPNTHRFLAFAYAQSKATIGNAAVVDLVQDGLIAAILGEHAGKLVGKTEIVTEISRLLRLSPDEANGVVSESLSRLSLTKHVALDGDMLAHDFTSDGKLDDQLSKLVDGVVDRMRVRDQVKASDIDRSAAREVIEGLFIARAWDFAAHYAGTAAGFGADLARIVHIMVDGKAREKRLSAPGAMEEALLDVFLSPDDSESVVLAEVGRIAFGLQLVLSSPRQALFHHHALPQLVYLDANVLMPAIVAGHPLRPVYTDAFRRLAEAARRASADLQIVVGQQFLNEIISHRAIAVQISKELDLDNPLVLEKHVLFYGATNTNVFIGAFASHVGRDRNKMRFSDFMNEFAPYTSELQLARYLQDNASIEIAVMQYHDDNHDVFNAIFNRLKEAYPPGRKASIVIEHEAQQLTRMRVDLASGKRSVFVTADNQLRRILQASAALHDVANVTMSHLGLVALVDVFVGISADSRSLSRLMWSTAFYGEEERALYEYFVRLALQEYSEGMATEMQELARATAREGAAEAKRESIDLFSKSNNDVVRSAKLIDRYGDGFFKNWREAVDEKERRDFESDRR